MKKSAWAAVLLLLLAAPAWGQIVLTGKPQSVHYLRVSFDASGIATITPLPVRDLRSLSPGPQVPENPTDPGDLAGLALKAHQLTGQVTADPDKAGTAMALAVVYAKIAQANPEDPMRHIKAATDAVLRLRQASEAWQPWRDGISAELTKRAQEGSLTFPDDLAQIAQGLRAAGDNPQSALDLALILEIVRLVLELLRNR